MKMAAKRTGLSPHVIRIWEKRYQAVTPARTPTNRRLYSDDEIERLILLKLATNAGHSIRNVASLDTEALGALVEREVDSGGPTMIQTGVRRSDSPSTAESFVEESISAVRRLDSEGLETLLSRALTVFGQQSLLQRILVPLIHDIGKLWNEGELKVAHEHIATAVIRTFLANLSRAHAVPPSAPELMVTTPSGQLHELGAVLVAAAAGNQGWRACYLGPCLPAEEIAGAALQNDARGVALSIVYPEDDPHMGHQLLTLRRLLPQEIPIMVGGRAALSYEATLKDIGAVVIADLADLRAGLDRFRNVRVRRT